MRRRDLLRGALGLGLLATVAPAAWASGSPDQQRAALSNAWRRAVLDQRPLLVIVIDEAASWERGRAIGNWLNNASNGDLAPLSQVEVVCGTLADLQRLVPKIGGDEDPWFVLVSPEGVATGVHVTLPELPPEDRVQAGRGHGPSEDWTRKMLSARAEAIEGALFPAITGVVGPLSGARETLGAQVRERLVTAPPPGAHWANSWGCGTTVEGVESNMRVGCGMGHVSAETARFLYFSDVSAWD